MNRADLMLPPWSPSGGALRLMRDAVLRLPAETTLTIRGTAGRFGPSSARSAFWDALVDAVAAHPGLTVAVVDGLAEGAALHLALACDIRLAGPDAVASLAPLENSRGTNGPVAELHRLLPPGGMARAIVGGGRWDRNFGQDQGLWDDALEADGLEDEVRTLAHYAAEVGAGQVRAMKAMLGG